MAKIAQNRPNEKKNIGFGQSGKKFCGHRNFCNFLKKISCLRTKFFRRNSGNARRYLNGYTPLHIACCRGQLRFARWLIAHGANPALRNDFDETPLMLAAMSNHQKLIKLLCGNSKFVHKFVKAFRSSSISRNDKMMIDASDTDANTALHLAAAKGFPECVTRLISYSANIDALNHNQETPLDCAAKNGHVSVCQILVENDATIDPVDKKGKTPLMLAVENNYHEVVTYLLEAGAKPYRTTPRDFNYSDETKRSNNRCLLYCSDVPS